jgi:thioesterase domain-containing protein
MTAKPLVGERDPGHAAAPAPAPSLFTPLRAAAGGLRLWCFPGHDGVLLGLIRMGHLLDRRVDTVGLVHDRLDPVANIEVHAQACADEIRRSSPGPYHLIGVCFGGCVAYEVARRLEADGGRVAFLALIDTLNPAWRHEHRLAARLAHARQWRYKLPHHLKRIVELGPREARTYLVERLRGAHKYRTEVSSFRDALGRYRPGPLRGDALVVRLRGRRLDAPDLGWRDRVEGRLEVVDVPLEPDGAFARKSGTRVSALINERLRATREALPR